MEVRSVVASAWGAAVVTGVQRADCREHNVSQIPDIPALQYNQQHLPLFAASKHPICYISYTIYVSLTIEER